MEEVISKSTESTRFYRSATRETTITFGTKAETLERLSPLLQTGSVPDLWYFTLAEWSADPGGVMGRIQQRFGSSSLAVRSSAYHEDTAAESMAGAFRSVLRVDGSCRDSLRRGIEEVLESYHSTHPHNQVLIQRMLSHVVMSGVLMTHDLTNGAPYYILNYDDESGRTDVITGGTDVNKSLVVHRDTPADFIESPRVGAVLSLARELESLTGGRTPLDIEFAQTSDGTVHLLQVRRIAVQRNWNRAVRTRISEALEQLDQFLIEHSKPRPGLPGATTLLGQMPDWNVAELIGTEPGTLALSLFRNLISDGVWQEARAAMGYRPVPDEPLVVSLAGRPYIDVRNSFSSFLPEGLPQAVENTVVNAWLERLAEHPEFHDKVEFQVAQTVFDFAFEQNLFSRYPGMLAPAEHAQYVDALRRLTVRNVDPSPEGSLAQALKRIAILENHLVSWPLPDPPLRRAFGLLAACRQYGSRPFAMVARHAFMAEAMLRSAIERRMWSNDRLEAFKRSLATPAGLMAADFSSVVQGRLTPETFLKRYGHLRPGTFDILSPRYDQRDDLFRDTLASARSVDRTEDRTFTLTAEERGAFAQLLKEIRLPLSPEQLFVYAAQAIVGREHAKFVFTRPLSDAVENIAEWGECIGLTREDLAHLSLHDLAETLTTPVTRDRETWFQELAQSRRTYAREMRGLHLGYIIRSGQDLYVVPQHRGAANFVTSKRLEGAPIRLTNRMTGATDLFGKLVCIECADPGFDWIFTKGIAGLITKFGGANSHMTIRCAELGIPAAIGVGESLFERLALAQAVELRCDEKLVRPAGV
jgi:hypothetical protein